MVGRLDGALSARACLTRCRSGFREPASAGRRDRQARVDVIDYVEKPSFDGKSKAERLRALLAAEMDLCALLGSHSIHRLCENQHSIGQGGRAAIAPTGMLQSRLASVAWRWRQPTNVSPMLGHAARKTKRTAATARHMSCALVALFLPRSRTGRVRQRGVTVAHRKLNPSPNLSRDLPVPYERVGKP